MAQNAKILSRIFFQNELQRLGVGKVQEFETVSCPTLRRYEKAIKLPNSLATCILLTPCCSA